MANGYGNLTPRNDTGRLGTLGSSDIGDYGFMPSWDLSTYLEGIGLWGQDAMMPGLEQYPTAQGLGFRGENPLVTVGSEYGLSDIYGGGLGPTSSIFQGGFDASGYQPSATYMDPVDYAPAFRSLYGIDADNTGVLSEMLGETYGPGPGFGSTYLESGAPEYTPALDENAITQETPYSQYIGEAGDPLLSPGGYRDLYTPQQLADEAFGDTGKGGADMMRAINSMLGLEAGDFLGSERQTDLKFNTSGEDKQRDALILGALQDLGIGKLPSGFEGDELKRLDPEKYGEAFESMIDKGNVDMELEHIPGKFESDFRKVAKDLGPGQLGYYGDDEVRLEDKAIQDVLEGTLEGPIGPRQSFQRDVSPLYKGAVDRAVSALDSLAGGEGVGRQSLQQQEMERMGDFQSEFSDLIGDEASRQGWYGDVRKGWDDYVEEYNKASESELEDRADIQDEIDIARRGQEDIGSDLGKEIADIDMQLEALQTGETPLRRRIRGFEGGGLRSGRRGRVGAEEEEKLMQEKRALELQKSQAIDTARKEQRDLEYDIGRGYREQSDITRDAWKDVQDEYEGRIEDIEIGEEEIELEGEKMAEDFDITGTGGIAAERGSFAETGPSSVANVLGATQAELKDYAQDIKEQLPVYAPGGEFESDLGRELTGNRGILDALATQRGKYAENIRAALGGSGGGVDFLDRWLPRYAGTRATDHYHGDSPIRQWLGVTKKAIKDEDTGDSKLTHDKIVSPGIKHFMGMQYRPSVIYNTATGAQADLHAQNLAKGFGYGRGDFATERKRKKPFGNWFYKYPQFYRKGSDGSTDYNWLSGRKTAKGKPA